MPLYSKSIILTISSGGVVCANCILCATNGLKTKKSCSTNNVEDVYLDNLINVIDNLVEKTSNYKQSVEEEYALF